MVPPPPMSKIFGDLEIELQPADLSDMPELAEIFIRGHDVDATVFNQMKDVPNDLVLKFYSNAFTSMFNHEKGVGFWRMVEAESGYVFRTPTKKKKCPRRRICAIDVDVCAGKSLV